jgi:TRAP-type mannitol/chloroaromatic compound transport system permease large subunit
MPRKRGPTITAAPIPLGQRYGFRGVAPPEVATRQIHFGIISFELAMLAVRRFSPGAADMAAVTYRMFRLRET